MVTVEGSSLGYVTKGGAFPSIPCTWREPDNNVYFNFLMYIGVLPVVCMPLYHVCVLPMEGWKKELGLQIVANYHVGAGMEHGSFGRSISALNH